MSNAAEVTGEREKTHGDYADTATIAQQLKRVVRNHIAMRVAKDKNVGISPEQLESLDMICTKIARIISGNPNEPDHWDDIGGYAHIAVHKAGQK